MKYILIPIGKIIWFFIMLILATSVYVCHFLYELIWNFRIEKFGAIVENGTNLSYYPFKRHIDKDKLEGYVYVFKNIFKSILGFKPLVYFPYESFHRQEYLYISKYIGKDYYYMVFKDGDLYKVNILYTNGKCVILDDELHYMTFENIKEIKSYLNIINGAVCKEFFYKIFI